LARPIGRQWAADLVFTGYELDAATAVDRGAVRSLRRSGRGGRGGDRARGLDRAVLPGQPGDRHGLAEHESDVPGENHGMRTGFGYLFAGPDAREGPASFIEDRDPDFAE
jgi:enoyl-CoA hydratase/carnithine racemase